MAADLKNIESVALDAGPFILALIDVCNDAPNGAVALVAMTAAVAYLLAQHDVEPLKFHNEVVGMMERRAQLLAKVTS